MIYKKKPYLIVGNGKLAKHFSEYFRLLNISFYHWHRRKNDSLDLLLGSVKKVIVLINDGEIEEFISSQSKEIKGNITWIHCSGMLSTELAEGAHPLMTFSDDFYDLQTYQSIPFITEEGKTQFNELFPELQNVNYTVSKELKSFYHAWCVISGNFTSILWNEFFNTIEDKLNIPRKAAYPYLKKTADNLINIEQPLTGPFGRGDSETIDKHLTSLTDYKVREIYEAFKNVYFKKKKMIGDMK